MSKEYEQRFYSALRDLFVGYKVKGQSGYVNLLSLKQKYFAEIEPYIKNIIVEHQVLTEDENISNQELFEKLYSFFDCYFNEIGTVFFSNSQLHKNLYEKIYSQRDDVNLFWKTQKLYYIKSEILFDDLETQINDLIFSFDASEIKHIKGNIKKQLKFFLVKVEGSKLIFKVRYEEKQDYQQIKTYLDIENTNELKDFLIDHKGETIHDNVNFTDTSVDCDIFTRKSDSRNCVFIKNENNGSVQVEISISDIELICSYLIAKNLNCPQEDLINALSVYKKQNEVDYFIHKDAKGFLEEQFDIYLYNWLFNDLDTEFDTSTINRIQRIKRIAYRIINYIAKFEDELKAMWEKPKFVLDTNYVISLKTLRKEISPNEYEQIKEFFISEYLSNEAAKNDLIFTIKEIVKQPLRKIYPNNVFINIEDNVFNIDYVKLFDSKEDLDTFLEAHPEESKYDGDIYERGNEILGFFSTFPSESLTKTIGIDNSYIDTKFLIEETKFKLLKLLTKNKPLDEIIDGTLIKGDNFQVLNSLSKKYANEISLIYIDPPFNTESNEFAFKDDYKDSTWLSMIENRISLQKQLLKKDSSFYLHLDHNCNYLARGLLKNKFDYEFKREIIWNTSPSPSGFKSRAQNFIRQHDSIFFLVTGKPEFNKMWINRGERGVAGWLDLFEDDNNVYVKKHNEDGELINIEVNSEIKKIAIGDVWNDIYSMMYTQNMTRENWSDGNTQKPENLLRRIIQSSSSEGDLIFDYYLGSGTTAAAAHKLNRKWIGSEIADYFDTMILPRLKTVVFGDIRPKLSEDTFWRGGGVFKYYQLEQYEDVLAKSEYLDIPTNENTLSGNLDTYLFSTSQKLLKAIEINYDKKEAKIVFEKLYENVDIAETLSLISGYKIKEVEKNRCILYDNEKEFEIIYDKMTFEDYPWIKPLIWWRSNGAS